MKFTELATQQLDKFADKLQLIATYAGIRAQVRPGPLSKAYCVPEHVFKQSSKLTRGFAEEVKLVGSVF